MKQLEADAGWDPETASFNNKEVMDPLKARGLHGGGESADANVMEHLEEMMDIVIPTIRDLDKFLGAWKPFIEKFHLILVQDGDPDKEVHIPEWADFELYNRRDIEASLGERAWIISQKDASIRNFGFLVSKKKLVYTIDDDCMPATGPDGQPVNPMEGHARNLLSPATPYFYNTVYDPYRDGSDFVRGYPYSLRAGVQTGVSHGLWLNNYDYDAPTQLLKVDERNEVYADATQTVPKGVLYPLCSMNVAFQRELMGPAFMQGLMGVGQPWSRYDDMWAGWASKTVADHIGVGCKSGAPYIKHDKASNPFVNLMKEYKGLEWQEEAVRFFDTVQLSEASSTEAGAAFKELADRVEQSLGHLNPYFARLAQAMRLWVDVWRETQAGSITFKPSRSSSSSSSSVAADVRRALPAVVAPATPNLRGLAEDSIVSSATKTGIIPAKGAAMNFPGDTKHQSSTTNPTVPDLFRAVLRQQADIDEEASDRLPAEEATKMFEEYVGWDPVRTMFNKRHEVIDGNDGIVHKGLSGYPQDLPLQNLEEMMDIVIPTIRDLDKFLGAWKPFIEKFHLILVQDGDPDKEVHIPEWADFELYNRRDIEASLGERAWIISQKDASIRNFGFLVSKKKLVYTIDDDCMPATGPDGQPVNPMEGHARNLLSPATPYFYNTVYDPYRDGSDFVRGYPYSLRAGVQTGVSHGLWLNNYDYDAPTQLLKVDERNEVYADATQTVPKGVLYPLCSMNVAFQRELMGPAFMQGLMGVGQPWSRYDDMWAGWASKTVADHIGVGCKSGAPYIKHDKASNPFVNLMKEYKGLEWQEEAVRFFDTVQLSEASSTEAGAAFKELADRVEQSLGHLNPYFARLAQAMRLWVDVWRETQAGSITFKPSRSSSSSSSSVAAGATTAVSTTGGTPAMGSMSCVTESVLHHENSATDNTALIERDRCTLSFPETSCTTFKETKDSDLSDADIKRAAQSQPNVVVVKCGATTPFKGDRASNLNRLVKQVSATGKFQIVFLMDVTSLAGSEIKPSDALPAHLAPLIAPYTKTDIDSTFPTKSLKHPPRARAISKYYEVYSWTWWYHHHGRDTAERMWVVEDDTVFTGDWGAFFQSVEQGLPSGSDLVTFRDFCTPAGNWPWLNWMHEGWEGLHTVGQVLESWMTIYGCSKNFLEGEDKEKPLDPPQYHPSHLAQWNFLGLPSNT